MIRKLYLSILLCLFIQFRIKAQIIDSFDEKDIDSILLAPDCKVDTSYGLKIFTRLEVLADYRGGAAKWFQYAGQQFNFDYVRSVIKGSNGIFHDSVQLKFVVTREGNVCNVNMISGNPILAKPAIRLLQSSGQWLPGTNGGRNLHSYRTLLLEVLIDERQKKYAIIKNWNGFYRFNSD